MSADRFTCGGSDVPLGRLIYLLGHDMKNIVEKALHPFDITLEQFHVLKCLVLSQKLTQREIGELTSKTPANTTRILDRLELKGLIKRLKNPEDRRASHVVITDKGRILAGEVLSVFEDLSQKIVHGVTKKEERLVREVFKRISGNLENISRELD